MPKPRLAAALAATALVITGCAKAVALHPAAVHKAGTVNAVAGTNRAQVHLTPEAVTRLDIQIGTVHDAAVAPRLAAPVDGAVTPAPTRRLVAPFAAVMYAPTGEAFTYVVAGSGLYERVPVTVEYVVGDLAVLSSGPETGTPVVTVGGPELAGIEFGTGE